jgi:hypothetical protein
MSSSTSSSDPTSDRAAWRRFFRLAAGTTAAVAAFVYLFVAIVDPFDTLPLSPPFDRAPIATNARFSFPALARSDKFDSAIFGSSTSRLLRPALLNPEFDARFANLAMNAATAYEQSQMLKVFLRAHPDAKAVMIGLDDIWCLTRKPMLYTPRPFPEWMYGANRWAGYTQLLNLYTVEQSGIQFATLLGLKSEVYGRDGYTSFVPDDSEYDPARVAAYLAEAARAMPKDTAPVSAAGLPYPAIDLLRDDLAAIPARTTKIVFFTPLNHVLQPVAGKLLAEWNECKQRVTSMAARTPNTVVVDFMIPSPITSNDDNYWDSAHYRVAIADRLARDLAAAAKGQASPDGDYRLLSPAIAAR